MLENSKEKTLGYRRIFQKKLWSSRKKKMKLFKRAKEDSKTAYFGRAEPDKLFIDGVQI